MGDYWFEKKLLFSAILFAMVAIFSVSVGSGGKDPDCSNTWNSELQQEINKVSKAAQNFEDKPSEITCNNYKASLETYLKALETYENCADLSGLEKVDWQNELDQAKVNVNSLDLLTYY